MGFVTVSETSLTFFEDGVVDLALAFHPFEAKPVVVLVLRSLPAHSQQRSLHPRHIERTSGLHEASDLPFWTHTHTHVHTQKERDLKRWAACCTYVFLAAY